ncbi:MAG: insulinase family protein [Candidatus Paceibacterota bacterium]
MHYNILKNDTYSIASITRPREQMVVLRIAIDIHTENTLRSQATACIYGEALVSGCKNYSRDEFHEAISLLGSNIDVVVNNNIVNITIKSTATNAKKVFEIYTCMIISPTFQQREFPRIKKLLINELIQKKEEAATIAHERLVNQMYDTNDRRYTYDTESLINEIQKVTRKDVLELHKKMLRNYWFCTIGSNEKVLHLFNTMIQHSKVGIAISKSAKKHTQNKPRSKLLLHDVPSRENIEFSIGGPLQITLHHPDYLPFVFGLNVLGKWGGFTGRLMSTVREKEGLTYGIYARTETTTGTEFGYWRIMSFFAPSKAAQGIQSTLRELKLITTKGITDDEFRRFKVILTTQQQLLSDSFERSVTELHAYHFAGFTLVEIEEFRNRLYNVSKKEVDTALKKYIDPTKLIISGSGPVKNVKKELSKLL